MEHKIVFTETMLLDIPVKYIFYEEKYYFCLYDLNQILLIPDTSSSVRDHCNSGGIIKVVAPLVGKPNVLKEQTFIDILNVFSIISSGTLKKRFGQDKIFSILVSFSSFLIPFKKREAVSNLSFLDSLGFRTYEELSVIKERFSDPNEAVEELIKEISSTSGYGTTVMVSDEKDITPLYSPAKFLKEKFPKTIFIGEEVSAFTNIAKSFFRELSLNNENANYSFKTSGNGHEFELEEKYYRYLISKIRENPDSYRVINRGRFSACVDNLLSYGGTNV